MPPPSRRTVLRGAGLAAVTVGAAAACGSGGTDDTSAGSSATTSASGGASGSSSAGASGGAELASVADVPVGGGLLVAAQKVVLTQPTAGDIKAFSTRCTHQGCAVSSVKDGFIVCPCHNSRFAIADGAPTADSPAKQPLATAAVTVAGGKVTLA
jgi:Rieske Fe-S protein